MRENKIERTIRLMAEPVSEHLKQLLDISKNASNKELDIERWVERVLQSCLGFSASNGYSIRAQESKNKMRPDLAIYKADKPVLVVEVKRLDCSLDKTSFRSGKVQLREYLSSADGVKWGLLCNGYEWRLFDFSVGNGIEVFSFDVRGESESLEFTKRAVEDLSSTMIDLHVSSFESGSWTELSKEATAFSPESLAKTILTPNFTRMVAKHIKGEHEMRANLDTLTDKLAELIENGLDDQVSDWNEAKSADLHKHIKSQKRAMKKKKVVKVLVAATIASPELTLVSSENPVSKVS